MRNDGTGLVIRCVMTLNALRTLAISARVHSHGPNLGPKAEPDGHASSQISRVVMWSCATHFIAIGRTFMGVATQLKEKRMRTRARIDAGWGSHSANGHKARPGAKMAIEPLAPIPRTRFPAKTSGPDFVFQPKSFQSSRARPGPSSAVARHAGRPTAAFSFRRNS